MQLPTTLNPPAPKQTVEGLIKTFLYIEVIHYALGAFACLMMPDQIPASFLPSGIEDCAGTIYVVQGVLFPFYMMTLYSVVQTILLDIPNQARPLARMMVCFFATLLAMDGLSLVKEKPQWTQAKYIDASIHVVLFACYMLIMVVYKPAVSTTFSTSSSSSSSSTSTSDSGMQKMMIV